MHGNVGLEYTTRNALKLIELRDVGIPVYGGASRPILQNQSMLLTFMELMVSEIPFCLNLTSNLNLFML